MLMHPAQAPNTHTHRLIDTDQIVGGSKLLGAMRDLIRRKHYSIRTGQVYLDWAKHYILFHGKRHPNEMGEDEMVAFLNHLAVQRNVAASTQNQALNALVFLYKQVLGREQLLTFTLGKTYKRHQSMNPSELFKLGCQYMSDGKAQKAVPLLKKAADNGHAFAASNLGILFYFGDGGLEQNYEEAFRYFEVASKNNDSTSLYYLARIYRFGKGKNPDIRAALQYYTKSAMAGMLEAQCELAELYVMGESVGVKRDLRKAIHWFAYAAEQGNTEAQAKFHLLYYHGYETSEKPTGFWFERESLENRKIPCNEPFSVLIKEGDYIAHIRHR